MNRFPCDWWLLPSCILGLVLYGVAFNAWAYSFQITWDAPTTREDGTELLLAEIDHYDLYADGELLAAVPGGDSTTQADLSPGQHCFAMKTVDTDGRESVFSNEVCKDLPSDANPNSVTIEITIIP